MPAPLILPDEDTRLVASLNPVTYILDGLDCVGFDEPTVDDDGR